MFSKQPYYYQLLLTIQQKMGCNKLFHKRKAKARLNLDKLRKLPTNYYFITVFISLSLPDQ